MAFKPFTITFTQSLGYQQPIRVSQILIFEINIFQSSDIKSERRELFSVDTPFRIDELSHGLIDIRPRCSMFTQYTFETLCQERIVNCRTTIEDAVEKYIDEVKYRRQKNCRIEELEKQISKQSIHHDRENARWKTLIEQIEQYKPELPARCKQLTEKLEKDKLNADQIIQKQSIEIQELKNQLSTKVNIVVEEEIPSDLKAQIQSLKLQLAAEKRISQKYARDLQEMNRRQTSLTAM
jgi:hypothetical protein